MPMFNRKSSVSNKDTADSDATHPMDETDGECAFHMLHVSIDEDSPPSNCCDGDMAKSSGSARAVEDNVFRPLDAADDCVAPVSGACVQSPVEPSAAEILELVEKYMEPKFGLIAELESIGLLSESDRESVDAGRTSTERNTQIIKLVLKRESTGLHTLMEALMRCDQIHVVNWFLNRTDAKSTDQRPLSDDECYVLNSLLPYLIETLDIDEILDTLFSMRCINWCQREHIGSLPTMASRNEEFVGILIKRSYADYQQFLTALDGANQGHVRRALVDYKCCSVKYSKSLQDLFPDLPEKPSLSESVSSRLRDLEKFLEPSYGLIPDLIAAAVLHRPEAELVACERTPSEKNEKIIKYVLKKSSTEVFLLVLWNGFQQHVVNFILNKADAKVTNIRPLSEEELSRLRTNLPHLLKSIETEPIIDHLLQKQCINDWQKQHLRESTHKNKELIDILIKRSFANFEDFVGILKKTGQGHVADVIGKPGGLLKMFRHFLRSA